MKEVLEKIGLSPSEIKVYLSLLDLGESTRRDIVHKSDIAGSKIYDVLERLKEKGLVSIYEENKVKHFKAINPKQILNYIEHKKEEVEKMEEEALSIIPQLMQKFNSSEKTQEVELLVGMKGLEILFREQVELLKKGDECYVIGGTKSIKQDSIVSFFQKIHLMREDKEIKTKMLYNLNQKKETGKFYSSKKYPNTETRYIEHTSPVAINVYKDRTAIIIFGDVITTIHIKSEEVAKSFQEHFELLWKQSRKA